MQKNIALFMVLLLCGTLALGCAKKADDGGAAPASGDNGGGGAEGEETSSMDTAMTTQVVFCGKCGHEKGSEACCADDCETCECGMHKGSAPAASSPRTWQARTCVAPAVTLPVAKSAARTIVKNAKSADFTKIRPCAANWLTRNP